MSAPLNQFLSGWGNMGHKFEFKTYHWGISTRKNNKMSKRPNRITARSGKAQQCSCQPRHMQCHPIGSAIFFEFCVAKGTMVIKRSLTAHAMIKAAHLGQP